MAIIGARRFWTALVAGLVAATVVALALVSSAGALPTCTDNFTGASGGDWATAANWDHGVPTSSSVACFTGKTVTVSTGTQSADSIQGGNLTINGGSLSLSSSTNGSSIADFSMSSGALSGPGALAVTGNFSWTGGTIAYNSAIDISQTGGGTFGITGTTQATLYGGSISTTSNATISNPNFVGVAGRGPAAVSTTGTLTFAAGSYSSYSTPIPVSAPAIITGSGNTTVLDYALEITGNGSSLGGNLTAGAISVDTGKTLTIPSGVTVTSGGGTINGTVTGHGTFVHNGYSGTTVAAGGALTVDNVASNGGTLSVDQAATYTAAGSTSLNGGTLGIGPAGASTGNLSIQNTSSVLNGPGALALSGNFSWTGGTIANSSGIAISQTGGGTFAITGTDQALLYGGSLTTTSNATISNLKFIGYPGHGTASVSIGGTLTFATGSYTSYSSPIPVSADGIIAGSGNTTVPDYALEITGTSSNLGGNLTAAGLSVDAGKTLTIPSGVTVSSGGGTINGTVTGRGTFVQNGYNGTTVPAGGALTVDNVAVNGGALSVDASATYTAATSTSLNGGTLGIGPAGASTGNLSIQNTSSYLNGPGALAVTGNFSWTGGTIANGSGIAISQTGGGTFGITGTDQALLYGGSLTTTSNATISNLKFIGYPGHGTAAVSIGGTLTFGTGSYSSYSSPIPVSAAGIVTGAGNTTVPDYALEITGASSSLAGNLTAAGLSVDAGKTLTIPSGVTVSSGGGTISGTVTGHGTFVQNGYNGTTVPAGGALTVDNVASNSGTLSVDQSATYTAATSTSLNGGTLGIGPAGASTGNLSVQNTSSYLNGPGALSVTGNFSWTGGTIAYASSIAISQTGGGTFGITGTDQALLYGGSLTTTSNATISNLKFIGYASHGTASVSIGGTLTFGTGSYSSYSTPIPVSAAGIVTGAGNTTVPDYALEITGAASSLAGNLTAAGLSVDTGKTLAIASGVTVTSGGGTISGTITGHGTFVQNGYNGTTVPAGGALTVDNVASNSGTLSVDASATYTAATSTSLNGGTLGIGPIGAGTGNLSIQNTSSYLNGPGALAVTGNFSWTGGTIANTSGIAISQTGGGTFGITGTDQALLAGGSLTTTSGATISNLKFIGYAGHGSASLTTSGTLTLAAGTYTSYSTPIPVSAAGIATSGDTTIPDYALILTGATTSVPGGETLTSGPVTVQGGTLQVDGTLSPTSTTLTGGTLKGTGIVDHAVANNGGTVAPGDSPGTLTVGGNYSQGAGGTLAIEVDGTGGGQASSLSVGGNVSLDGTLSMRPTATYTGTAAPGDTFDVLQYASGTRSGTFATVNSQPALGAGQSFSADYSNAHQINAVVGGPPAPTNTALPQISGTATQGQQLSTTNGSWTNNPTAFHYQWEDCDAGGNNCTNTGSDASTYTLTASDVGSTIRVKVTAVNLGGSTPATSGKTGSVLPLAPANTTPPQISGTTTDGHTLSTSNGAWANNPASFHYQWEDCDAGGNNCTNTGTDASTYGLTASDIGSTIRVIVTATNAGGHSAATSDRTAAVAANLPPAPTSTGAPAISGTPAVNSRLACSNGAWTGNPTSFDYAWSRDGSGIAGAGQSTYTVQPADQGHTLTCAVTAHNAGGAGGPVTSAGVIVPPATAGHVSPPVNVSPPVITGNPVPPNTISCSPGAWTNDPTSFAYQWWRGSTPIPGASSPSYTVQILDEAQTLTCVVTATNAAGASAPAQPPVPVIVAVKGTLTCPKPTGTLGGGALGPLSLGMTQAAARGRLHRFKVTSNRFDNFCLYAGWGIRVAYPSRQLLSSLPRHRRHALAGRVVIALTANPFYSLHGATPGLAIAAVAKRLHVAKPVSIGSNQWYVVGNGASNGLLKVRHGIIQEVGIANRALTATHAQQRRFLGSFNGD